MCLSWQKKLCIELLASTVFLISFLGCQHTLVVKPADLKFPIELKLKGHPGKTDLVSYHSESAVKTVGTDKIARNKIETTDFQTETKTIWLKEGELKQQITVSQKEGDMELHDMAFPELNEKIDVIYKTNGDVVEAGEFAKDGIFYVPRISLPDKPVNVGDEWKMQSDWVSSKNQIKMQLNLTTKFKRVIACGKDSCADLEVEGHVLLPGINSNVIKLSSSLKGRIYFAIGEGTEVWSEIRNVEEMTIEGIVVKVEACLESTIRKPNYLQIQKDLQLDCAAPFESEEIELPSSDQSV